MRKVFAIAMLIVGTVIGAGFASGRELVSFFGVGSSPLVAVLCGILIFVTSVLFLYVGTKSNGGDISSANMLLCGKYHFVLDTFLLFNSFIVLTGMLAGMDSVGNMFFECSPLYSISFGALAIVVVCKGSGGIMKVNKIIVPIIIVLLIIVCLFTTMHFGYNESEYYCSVSSVAIYICMNMMLAGSVLTTMGKLSKKEIVLSSLIAAIVMATLIFVLMLALNSFGDSEYDMPVLYMAKQISPLIYAFVVACVVVSIFTTMMAALSGLVSWFCLIFKSKIFSGIVVILGAYILSNIGFSKIISTLYPLIGVLGAFYVSLALIYGFRKSPLTKPCNALFKQCYNKIHRRGKRTKNNSCSHNKVEFKHLTAVDDKVSKPG